MPTHLRIWAPYKITNYTQPGKNDPPHRGIQIRSIFQPVSYPWKNSLSKKKWLAESRYVIWFKISTTGGKYSTNIPDSHALLRRRYRRRGQGDRIEWARQFGLFSRVCKLRHDRSENSSRPVVPFSSFLFYHEPFLFKHEPILSRQL